MAELKFDHTKDANFLESLGLEEKDMQEINVKLAQMSEFILIKSPKKSELVEKIAQTFSYKELLLVTTFFVIDKTDTIIKDNPILTMLIAISELKNDKK